MKDILLTLTVFLSLNAGAVPLPGDGPSNLLDRSTGDSSVTVGAGTTAPHASGAGDCAPCRALQAIKQGFTSTLQTSRLSPGGQRRVLPGQVVIPSTQPANGQGQEQNGSTSTGN